MSNNFIIFHGENIACLNNTAFFRYQKICDKDGAAKKVKEWEGEGRKKRHAPTLEEVEAEEIEKRLGLQGPAYPLTKKDAVVKSRMRRGDHFQRALELIGLKKKKEKLCHHIPHKHCVMVSPLN